METLSAIDKNPKFTVTVWFLSLDSEQWEDELIAVMSRRHKIQEWLRGINIKTTHLRSRKVRRSKPKGQTKRKK